MRQIYIENFSVKSGVPQEALLAPVVSILQFNDLRDLQKKLDIIL